MWDGGAGTSSKTPTEASRVGRRLYKRQQRRRLHGHVHMWGPGRAVSSNHGKTAGGCGLRTFLRYLTRFVAFEARSAGGRRLRWSRMRRYRFRRLRRRDVPWLLRLRGLRMHGTASSEVGCSSRPVVGLRRQVGCTRVTAFRKGGCVRAGHGFRGFRISRRVSVCAERDRTQKPGKEMKIPKGTKIRRKSENTSRRDHEDALKDDGTHIGPFGPRTRVRKRPCRCHGHGVRRALGSFRCGLTAMLMGGALSFFFIDVLGGADVDYMCAFAARLRVGSDSFLAALPFSFDKLDGMDEYNLDVCAGALFGFDRPNLSDANDVAYNFVGCFSDDFHLGRETVVDGADRVRLDPHAGRRIGEASHPGPAGSRRTKRLRSQAFDKVAVRKICQQVLREFVAEWNGQGNVDAGDRGCSWNRSSDRWWTERTGELYHASTTRAPWDDQSDNDYQAAADNHGRRHDHMHNWWGSSTTSRADDSSSTWASWDDAAVAGARAGRAVSYYSAVSPEASWHTTQDDWWASSSRQRWADMLDDGPEDPVVAGQQHDVARGWGPTRRVEINTSAVGRDLSSKSRWRRKHAKAQPLDRDGADIDGASCEGPWALRKDVWHASCPIVFAASASAVSEILDSAAGVAIVAWTDNSHTADEIWELVASEGLDADGADVSLTLLCESTPSNAQWTPGDNTPPDVIPVPGTVDGKLRHKKCLMVTSGASPAKLSTRQTGTHEVRKPPPSLAAQRAASVVVRFTADCVYGTTPWADLKKQPAQRARSWASQHGVRQADIIDAYGFGVHGDNRLTGLMRIRNEVSARKLWTASGAFAAGLVFFVDVIGEGHRNLTANWAKDDDIVVQWHDWEVQESFEEYRARVLKFASFGLVLGRRLGCRLGSKDPNFKAQPSLWRARAIPHNYGIADVAALLEDLGFSQVGVQTLHRGRKTNDWTFRGMRDDRQTMLQQHIAWGGGLESDLVVVRESARRGPAGQDSQFAPITERRTVTFGDAMQQRPSSRKPKKDKSRPAASAPSVSPPLGSAPHSGEVAESDVQTSKGTKRAGPEDTAKMSVDAEARDASWAPVATLLDNPGGGNCLFWAMAQAGFQNKAPNEVTHRQMRRFAVQCLQSQESDLGVMWARAGSFNSLGRPSELTWPQYITEISTAANWGGSLEVAAVCIGTDFRAWIFEHKEDRLSLLNPSGKAGFVLLQYDSEKQHWQAFREVNEETLLARHRDTGEAMFDVVASQLRGGMAKPSLSECASVSSENQCDDAHSSGGDAARPGRFLTLSECASSLDGGPTEVEQVCSGAQGGGSVPGPSPSATRVGPLWSDEQRWAYAALCSALFDAETLQGEPTIREAVGAAFGGLASCPAAARGVLAHLSDEVALLHGHADADPWTSEQHHAIRTVLGELHRIFDHCRLPSLSECASSCGGDDVHGGVDGHADPPCASRSSHWYAPSAAETRSLCSANLPLARRVRGKQTAPCISFVTRGDCHEAVPKAASIRASVTAPARCSAAGFPTLSECASAAPRSGVPPVLSDCVSSVLRLHPQEALVNHAKVSETVAGACTRRSTRLSTAALRSRCAAEDSDLQVKEEGDGQPPKRKLLEAEAARRRTKYTFAKGQYVVPCPHCEALIHASTPATLCAKRYAHIKDRHPGMPQVGRQAYRPELRALSPEEAKQAVWCCPIAGCVAGVMDDGRTACRGKALTKVKQAHRATAHKCVSKTSWAKLCERADRTSPAYRQQMRACNLNASAATLLSELKGLGFEMITLPMVHRYRRKGGPRQEALRLRRIWTCTKCHRLLNAAPLARKHKCSKGRKVMSKDKWIKAVKKALVWSKVHPDHGIEVALLERLAKEAVKALEIVSLPS